VPTPPQVAIREGTPLLPTISFEDWRAEQRAGGSAEPVKANGKGKGKGKGKGSKLAGPKPTADDDVDALVASIEAAASEGPSDTHDDADANAADDADAQLAEQRTATPPVAGAAAAPELSGRRVRIEGLAARPELNGRCGVARRFDVAKGRYEVVVEGEAAPLLLKGANLLTVIVAVAEPAPGRVAESTDAAAAAEAGESGAGAAAREAAREAARAEVRAKVAAARAAQVLGEAAGLAQQEEGRQQQQERKLHLEDLLSAEEAEAAGFEKSYEKFDKNDKFDNTSVKDFRMQGEFGAKKFIKP